MEIKETQWNSIHVRQPISASIVIPDKQPASQALIIVGDAHTAWLENTHVADLADSCSCVIVTLDDLNTWGGIDRPQDGFYYEDFLRDEFFDYVLSDFSLNLRSLPCTITGFSKGSYMALRLGLRNPQLFSRVVSCSGGNADGYGLYFDMEKLVPGLVATMFPGITSARQFELSDYNLENVIRHMAASHEHFPQIDLFCGNDDTVARGANVRLDGVMSENHVEHTFTLLEGYPHGWHTADVEIHRAFNRELSTNS